MRSITIFPNDAVVNLREGLKLEISFQLLSDALIKHGLHICIVAQEVANNTAGNWRNFNDKAQSYYSLGRVKLDWLKSQKVLNYMRQLPSIICSVKKSEFCYIFAPGHVGLMAFVCCWLLRIQYAVYLRGDFHHVTPRILWFLYRHLLSRAAFVLTTGDRLRDAVRTLNSNCDAVVPMSPVLFSKTDEKSDWKEDKWIRILFVGQMLQEKGIFELLDAFERVNCRITSSCQLIMVGDGMHKHRLEEVAKAKGLQDRVHCLGKVIEPERLAEMYRQASVFVLPTYSEGFPRVLYEAMRFSVPIITTRVGQIPHLIIDGKNGLLCEPRSVDSLVEKLVMLLNDANFRLAVGSAGRTTVEPLLERWYGKTHGHQVLHWLFETNDYRLCDV